MNNCNLVVNLLMKLKILLSILFDMKLGENKYNARHIIIFMLLQYIILQSYVYRYI